MKEPASASRASGAWAKRWLLVVLGLATFGISWAVFEFVVWNRLPPEIVGKWIVTNDGPLKDATFEFHRSGKMIGHVEQEGNLGIMNGMVRVEGSKLYTTTRHPQTGQEMTTVQSIRTLTASEFVVQDYRGEFTKMKRAD